MPIQDKVYYDSIGFKFLKWVDNEYITVGAVNDLVDSVTASKGIWNISFNDSFQVGIDAHSPVISLGNLDSDENTITWTCTQETTFPGNNLKKISKVIVGGTGIFTIAPSMDLDNLESIRQSAESPNYYTVEGTISSATSNMPRFTNVDSNIHSNFSMVFEYDPYKIDLLDANYEEGLKLLTLGAPNVKFSQSSKFITDTQSTDMLFNNAGSQLYVSANSESVKKIYQYPVTNFKIENIPADTDATDSFAMGIHIGLTTGKSSNTSYISGMTMNDSENKFFIADKGHNRIYQLDLASAENIGSAKYNTSFIENPELTFSTPVQNSNMRDFTYSVGAYYWKSPYLRIPAWSSGLGPVVFDKTWDTRLSRNGEYYYTMDHNKIKQYKLKYPNDISTLEYVDKMNITQNSVFWNNSTVQSWYGGFGITYREKRGINTSTNNSQITQHFIESVTSFDPIGNPHYVKAGFPNTVKTGFNAYFGRTYFVNRMSYIHTAHPQCFTLSEDGLNLYIVWGRAYNRGRVVQYSLSIPFDITTATEVNSLEHEIGSKSTQTVDVTASKIFGAWSINFNSDGTEMFIWDSDFQRIYGYTLSVAWDISTINIPFGYIDRSTDTYSVVSPLVSMTSLPKYFRFNNNGTKVYFQNETNMIQYSMSTAYDVSTMTLDTQYDTFNSNGYGAFNLNDSETSLYSPEDRKITQYSLNPSLADSNDSADINSRFLAVDVPKFKDVDSAINTSYLTDVLMTRDGTKMYLADNNNNDIHLFLLSDSNMVYSAVFESSFTGTGLTDLRAITLTANEDKIIGVSFDGFIREYLIGDSLFSNMIYNNHEFKSSGNYNTNVVDMKFNPEGNQFYTLGKSATSTDYSFDLYKSKTNFVIKAI